MDVQSILNDELLKTAPVLCGFKVLPPVVLVERLGEGAMGSVFRGRHLNLDIDVAVKCLKAELLAQNPEYVARFQREAKIAASINQENLVRVLDTLQDYNCCYTVMEFVDGETIEGRVIRKGPLSVEESLSIILPSIRAMAALHAAKIVHRDIKPPNIMVSQSGVVKLTDLGIAKEEQHQGTLQTNPQAVMGTPQYMPPEQFENTFSVNDRADIYAMGATLAFMLIGNHAIQGASMHEILKKVCVNGFPPLTEFNPQLPDPICEIVKRCTALDPKQRPDARTLMRDLTGLLYNMGGEVPLADANASRSYGTGAMPSRLDRNAVQQIKAAITQTRPSTRDVAGAMGSLTAGSVPRTMIEQPGQTYVPPEGRRKKSALPKVLISLALLGLLGAGGAAATVMFYPPAKAWAMNLAGQKPADNGGGTGGNNLVGGNTGGNNTAGAGSNNTAGSGSNNTVLLTGNTTAGSPPVNGGNLQVIPPTIAQISFESVEAPDLIVGASSAAIPLSYSGFDGRPADLRYETSSENDRVVPSASVRVEVTGGKPMLSYRCGGTPGSTTLVIRATKGTEAAGELRVPVTVLPAPKPKRRPVIGAIAPIDTQVDQPTGELSVLQITDEDTPLDQLTVTCASDNQDLLPDRQITIGPRGAPRWIRFEPARGKDGKAKVTIRVSDGDGLFAETTVMFTVERIARPPTIAALGDINRRQNDTDVSTVRLKLGDEDTALGDLTITVTSSDEQLIPKSGLNLTQERGEWVLSIKPTPGASGQARVSVTVSDGATPPVTTSFTVVVAKPTASELFADDIDKATLASRNADWDGLLDALESATRNVATDEDRRQLAVLANNSLGAFRRATPQLKERRTKYTGLASVLSPLADTRKREFSTMAALLMVEQLIIYTDEDRLTISPELDLASARQLMVYAKSAYQDPLNPQLDACVHAALVQRFIAFDDEQRAKESVRVQLALECLQPALNARNVPGFNNGDACAWASIFYGTQARKAYDDNGQKESVESTTLANKADALLTESVDKGSALGMVRRGANMLKIAADLETRGGDAARVKELRDEAFKLLDAAARKGLAAAAKAAKAERDKLRGKYP